MTLKAVRLRLDYDDERLGAEYPMHLHQEPRFDTTASRLVVEDVADGECVIDCTSAIPG